ncbi:MAG: hypothetical protein ACUZ8I_10430 [Candidatus Scalindua sp.]
MDLNRKSFLKILPLAIVGLFTADKVVEAVAKEPNKKFKVKWFNYRETTKSGQSGGFYMAINTKDKWYDPEKACLHSENFKLQEPVIVENCDLPQYPKNPVSGVEMITTLEARQEARYQNWKLKIAQEQIK